tara:strand:- start:7352 stop:8659 length:1308 start_codon:yes stop_codon:yes gene_type:complete
MSDYKSLLFLSGLMAGSLTQNVTAQETSTPDLETLLKILETQAQQIDRQARELERQRLEIAIQKQRLDRLTGRETNAAPYPSGTIASPPPARLIRTKAVQTASAPETSVPEDAATRPSEEQRPQQEITVIADVGGVLTPKGQLTIEPTLTASHTSSNRFFFQGVEFVDSVLIGVIEATETRRNYISGQLGFRYGLTNRMEVSTKVPFIYRDDRVESTIVSEQNDNDGSSTTLQDLSGEGLGDIEFGIQYQLNDGQENWPYFVANIRAKSRTGEGPFEVDRDEDGLETELATGSGFWSVEPSLTMIYQTDPAVFFTNFGYIWNIGRDVNFQNEDIFISHVDPGDAVTGNFGIGFALNETLSMSFGYQHNYIFGTETEINGRFTQSRDFQVGSLLFGLALGLGERTGLSMNVAVGVTDDSPDVEFTLRMPFSVMLFE